jgi:lysyl-tRNA synthetase class 2
MLSFDELHIRAALLSSIRNFFSQQEFLEVDTPIRQSIILPESNIQPIQSGSKYLQTSPESCMKRLLAQGCRRIFQIARCFRKEEKGRCHLEEFVMLEWYRTEASYADLIQDCLDLLRFLSAEMVRQYPELRSVRGSILSKGAEPGGLPWRKITVAEAFARWSPFDLHRALGDDQFDEILVEYIEPNLGVNEVTFLYDYPASMASLAKKNDKDPDTAERFEMYLQGVEIANGFSELTDPFEQRSRFQKEIETIFALRGEQMQMPETFLAALGTLPDCAGIALGVDRLFMLMLGKSDVGEVVAFPPDDV